MIHKRGLISMLLLLLVVATISHTIHTYTVDAKVYYQTEQETKCIDIDGHTWYYDTKDKSLDVGTTVILTIDNGHTKDKMYDDKVIDIKIKKYN